MWLVHREGDVVEHVQRIEQRRALEHHAHPFTQRERFDSRDRADVAALDEDLAAVGEEQAEHQAQDRGLSDPGAPENAERTPPGHAQRDPAKDLVPSEGEPHIPQFDLFRPLGGAPLHPQFAADLFAKFGLEGLRPRLRSAGILPLALPLAHWGKMTMRIWVMK